MTKTVVVFQSDLFDRSWPKDQKELETVPWGADLAKFFVQELDKRGIQCERREPTVGEGGWTIYPSAGRDRFSLFFQWLPVGQPAEDFWVIQPAKPKGCIGSLFGGTTPSEELEPICSQVRAILESEKKITRVSWLTLDEFRQLCLRGRRPGDALSV